MKKLKRVGSFGLALAMVTALCVGCSGEKDVSSDTESSDKGVTISLLNTKSELVDQFDELAKKYKEETGVTIDVQFTSDVVGLMSRKSTN